MKNLKISTRLAVIIGTLCVLLVGIGATGLFGIDKSNAALRSVYKERLIPTRELDIIVRTLLRNRLLIAASLATPTPAEIAKNTAEIDENIALISKTWEAYMTNSLGVEEQKLSKQFAEDRRRFVQEGMLPTVAALRTGNINEAQRIAVEQVRPLYELMSHDVDALINAMKQQTAQHG